MLGKGEWRLGQGEDDLLFREQVDGAVGELIEHTAEIFKIGLIHNTFLSGTFALQINFYHLIKFYQKAHQITRMKGKKHL